MDVFLTRELETWIRERVSDGGYTSEGQLVRQAIRLLREHDERIDVPREIAPVPPRRESRELQVAPAK